MDSRKFAEESLSILSLILRFKAILNCRRISVIESINSSALPKNQPIPRISKGICTAVGLAATSLLFTPAAPAAVIALGSTAAAGGVTTAVCEYFKSKSQTKELQMVLELSREAEKIYVLCKEEIERDCEEMIRLGIRPAEARAKALGLRKLKPFVSGSVFLTKNAIKTVEIMDKLGKFAIPSISAGAKVGLQLTGKVLGAAASAIDVVDLTFTLLRKDPNIDTALKIIDLLIPQIEELERERAWLQSLHDEIQLEIQKLKMEYFSLESEESEIGDNE